MWELDSFTEIPKCLQHIQVGQKEKAFFSLKKNGDYPGLPKAEASQYKEDIMK